MRKAFFILLLSVVFACKLYSQETPEHPASSFIAVFVGNFDSTIVWYQQKLGCKIVQQESVPERNIKFAMLQWNDFMLEMIQNPKVTTKAEIKSIKPDNAGTEGFFKLGFKVKDIKYWEQLLKKRNVKFKYPLMNNERFKMQLFIIEDPEGNLIQFYSFTS